MADFTPISELPGVEVENVPEVQFADLTHGRTAYRVWKSKLVDEQKDSDVKTVVLVHGLSSFSFLYHPVAQMLVASQPCKVITLDLYGRGMSMLHSEHQNRIHNLDLFVTQLRELFDHLFNRESDEVKKQDAKQFDVLVGLSMGGAIVAEFARLYGDRFSTVVMLAPAGLPVVMPLAAQLIHIPWVGDAIWYFFGPSGLRSGAGNDFPEKDRHEFKEHTRVLEENVDWCLKNNPQWQWAILNSLRNFPLNTAREVFEGLGQAELPKQVVLVWGNRDDVCPYKNCETLLELIPRAKLNTLEECGHWIPINKTRELYEIISKLL
jgi:pimeloyl-ACP methyl ester carboxylesterase